MSTLTPTPAPLITGFRSAVEAGFLVCPAQPGSKYQFTDDPTKAARLYFPEAIPARATDQLDVVVAWSERIADVYAGQRTNLANIKGVVQAGFVVVDVDPRNGGMDSLDKFQRDVCPLPQATYTWLTASTTPGRNFVLTIPTDVDLSKTLSRHGYPGLEFHLAGAVVMLPPSHRCDTGRAYQVVDSSAPAPAPDAFVKWLKSFEVDKAAATAYASTARPLADIPDDEKHLYISRVIETQVDYISHATEGNRAETLNRSVFILAQYIHLQPTREGEALNAIDRAVDGWPNKAKVSGIIKAAWAKGQKEPVTVSLNDARDARRREIAEARRWLAAANFDKFVEVKTSTEHPEKITGKSLAKWLGGLLRMAEERQLYGDFIADDRTISEYALMSRQKTPLIRKAAISGGFISLIDRGQAEHVKRHVDSDGVILDEALGYRVNIGAFKRLDVAVEAPGIVPEPYLTPTQQRVVVALSAREMGTADVVDAIPSASKRAIKQALADLLADGYIERDAEGMPWRLAPEHKRAAAADVIRDRKNIDIRLARKKERHTEQRRTRDSLRQSPSFAPERYRTERADANDFDPGNWDDLTQQAPRPDALDRDATSAEIAAVKRQVALSRLARALRKYHPQIEGENITISCQHAGSRKAIARLAEAEGFVAGFDGDIVRI